MTTYGLLKLVDTDDGRLWGVQAAPHVAIKFKRLFPRVRPWRSGWMSLKDTPEVCRDIAWFMDRWPLAADAATLAHLSSRAEEARTADSDVEAILAGQRTIDGWQEPARPARPYQQQAADVIGRVKRLLLADDLGLGKTQSAILTLRDPDALPALVVCPTHLPAQWLRELHTVLPWLNGHVVTAGQPYDPAERRGSGGHSPDVLIMSYSKLAGWGNHLAGAVHTVIFDECQELRRGQESAKGEAAGMVADKALYVVGLSATPVYNYGGEVWNILNVIAPDVLGSREEFLREWGGQSSAGMGRNITVADPRALGTYLRSQHVFLRRTRKDVQRELPEPVLIRQDIDTNRKYVDDAARDVEALARLLLSEESTRDERFHAAGEIDWRLRQATGIAKAPHVAAFVRLLLDSERKVVLFGWHRAVYEQWLDLLTDFHPVLYTGTESANQKARSAEEFITGQSRVLIMSLRSGMGLDGLQQAASVAVFGELDWSPGMHEQCVGRLHRDGQDSTVVAYYLVSDAGTDPPMEEVLGLKVQQAEPLRDPTTATIRPVRADIDRARRLAQAVLERRSGQQQIPAEPAPAPAPAEPTAVEQQTLFATCPGGAA